MNDKFFGFVHKHPVWTILFSLLLAFAAAGGAQKLSFKSDYRIFFSEDDPQLVAYESMQKIYNKSDSVSFIVVPESGDVFTAKHLAGLQELTKQSWQVPYSTRVDSLTNFQHTWAEDDDMIVEDLVYNLADLDEKRYDYIRTIALNEPTLVNRLVSPSGDVTVINVSVNLPDGDQTAEVDKITESVKALTEKYKAKYPEHDFYENVEP